MNKVFVLLLGLIPADSTPGSGQGSDSSSQTSSLAASLLKHGADAELPSTMASSSSLAESLLQHSPDIQPSSTLAAPSLAGSLLEHGRRLRGALDDSYEDDSYDFADAYTAAETSLSFSFDFDDDNYSPASDGVDLSEISRERAWIISGIVTVVSFFFIGMAQQGKIPQEIHSKLLLQASAFSTAEGISLLLMVPSSKESLMVGAAFFYGVVAALSSMLLRKAGLHFLAVVSNAILEALFAAVVLFFFVTQSTGSIWLFGTLAANEALIGLAIYCYVDKPVQTECKNVREDPAPRRAGTGGNIGSSDWRQQAEEESETLEGQEREEEREVQKEIDNDPMVVMLKEICFLVYEAVVDVTSPLFWSLIKPIFHPDSAWRSDIVFTISMANTSAIIAISVLCALPPAVNLGFGAKIRAVGCGLFSLVGVGQTLTVLWLTLTEIDDPPTVDIVFSAVVVALQALSFLQAMKWWYCDGVRLMRDDEDVREFVDRRSRQKK